VSAAAGGDNFSFNEAVSFVIPCKDQQEKNA
jgi:predicted 3-demethylubiquinone-9 3-methyltransferase (glyoxalase superfamily)